MNWHADDGDALFRGPSDEPVDEHVLVPDGSQEAMRRLRFPFEADPADAFEQHLSVPMDDDGYRR